MSIGKIDVLNVKKGHDPIEFSDAEDANTKINDMMRKNYTIFAESGGETYKVLKFDKETSELIVQDEKRLPLKDTKLTAAAPFGGG